MAENKPNPTNSLPFPEYFTLLARNYPQHTANSTRDLFQAVLEDVPPITNDSSIHDNASGPGTAASILIEKYCTPSSGPRILITDNVPAMIDVAKEDFKSYSTVSTEVLDSHRLSSIPSDTITHSILNFSIFTFQDPVQCLKEIHRTLQSGGTAAISTWKRFGIGSVIHAAQKSVRPDLPVMKIPGAEFMQEGYLAEKVKEVWSGHIQAMERMLLLTGDNLQRAKEFMLGRFTGPARRGWTEEEVSRWPKAVEEALQEELNTYGGLKMEAWVVIAKK